MTDQMRYEGRRPPMAAHWPVPPGGWPDEQWTAAAVIPNGLAEGASTTAELPPAESTTFESAPAESAASEPSSAGSVPIESTASESAADPEPEPPDRWPRHAAPPPSGRPKHLALILSIVTGVVMIGVISAATTAAFFATHAYRQSKAQVTVGMDTPVRDGKFQFTADGVRCGVHEIDSPTGYQSPTGQFCVVTLSIKNVGKNPAIFADAIQKAYGAGGVSFISDSEAGFYANPNPDVFLNDINPGNKVQVLIVYDIPPSGHITQIEVHENPTTKGAIIKVS